MGEVGAVVHLPEDRVAALRSDPRFGDLVRRMGLVRTADGNPPSAGGSVRD
jgi:hypothetical protein